MEVQASSLRISTKEEAFSQTRERARKDSQYYCQGKMSYLVREPHAGKE